MFIYFWRNKQEIFNSAVYTNNLWLKSTLLGTWQSCRTLIDLSHAVTWHLVHRHAHPERQEQVDELKHEYDIIIKYKNMCSFYVHLQSYTTISKPLYSPTPQYLNPCEVSVH